MQMATEKRKFKIVKKFGDLIEATGNPFKTDHRALSGQDQLRTAF